MRKIRIIVSLLLLACLSLSAAALQAQTVRGNVVDENSGAVAGVVVQIQGTTIGAISDMDGKFTLNNVPADQRTVGVTYPGYENQSLTLAEGQTELTIQLVPSNNELDEVVAVGYGAVKRAHLTGAVATVTPAEIADLSSSSLSALLEGMIPGVSVNQESNRPGEAAKLKIRGQDKILYVIDDVISTEEAFNNLDPSEIESMSLLKDAAAAVYGSRSANGAMVVKTKRGHIGKTKISYSGQFGYTDEFYRSKMMNSYDHARIWNGMRTADPTQTIDPRKQLFQADELEAMKNINYDLLDKYWSGALAQKHGVTLSGGSENLTAFGSITYQTQDGNIGKLKYDRWNFRTGLDAKVNEWMKASLTVSGDYGSNKKANNRIGGSNDEKDYNMLQSHPTYIPEYVTDPETGIVYPMATLGVSNSVVTGGGDNQTQLYHFDVLQNSGDYIQNMSQNMTINGSLEYDFGWSKILNGLKLKATYAKTINTTKNNTYATTYELHAFADDIYGRGGSGNHLYEGTAEHPLYFEGMRPVPANNGDFLYREMSRKDSYQLNFYATYARSFGLHDISALFTIERSESEDEDLTGRHSQPFKFTNFQYNGANGEFQTNFTRGEAASLSYVGRINYAYNGRYLAELMIRTDASTKFAPENYWGTFPSMSVGWIISQESWFADNVHFMDFLKLRGSFGILGNDNIDAWAWQQFYNSEAAKGPIFGTNPDLVAGPHFAVPNNVPNRNSHWDKSYQYNAGLDMYFLKSRLTANLDGYYRRNKEVFEAISSSPGFPTTVGANASSSNFGENANWGVELSLGWKDKIGKDASYWAKLNLAYSDDKVIKFAGMDNVMTNLDSKVVNERSDRGKWGMEAIGMFTTYQEIGEYFAENNLTTYLGKSQADIHPGMLIYKDIRGSQKDDGTYYEVGDPSDPKKNVIDKDLDRVKISNRGSNMYGFTLNFGGQWKSLSFSAQLGASWGSYTFIPTDALSPRDLNSGKGWNVMEYVNMPSFWANNMFVYDNVLDAQGNIVAEQNRNAKYPSMRFDDNFIESTFWKVNNANVFLRNVTIAYTLPKNWVNKLGVESCRINVTGQNLLEFYNPYPDKFMSPNSKYGKYPLLRKFTFGLNITL